MKSLTKQVNRISPEIIFLVSRAKMTVNMYVSCTVLSHIIGKDSL